MMIDLLCYSLDKEMFHVHLRVIILGFARRTSCGELSSSLHVHILTSPTS